MPVAAARSAVDLQVAANVSVVADLHAVAAVSVAVDLQVAANVSVVADLHAVAAVSVAVDLQIAADLHAIAADLHAVVAVARSAVDLQVVVVAPVSAVPFVSASHNTFSTNISLYAISCYLNS